MHASVHMFIEFVCIRVFKGGEKECAQFVLFGWTIVHVSTSAGQEKKRNVRVSTKIDFILCCVPSRRPSCGTGADPTTS